MFTRKYKKRMECVKTLAENVQVFKKRQTRSVKFFQIFSPTLSFSNLKGNWIWTLVNWIVFCQMPAFRALTIRLKANLHTSSKFDDMTLTSDFVIAVAFFLSEVCAPESRQVLYTNISLEYQKQSIQNFSRF